MDEKKLAEEAKRQAESQGLNPSQQEQYIRDYVAESIRINNRFTKEVARLGLNATQEEIFRSLLTTTPNQKPDGSTKTEEEIWSEVIDKMEVIVKPNEPADTTKETETETKETETETEPTVPPGEMKGRERNIEVTDTGEEADEDDYPLADDDKYFEWRQEAYRKLKQLKQVDPTHYITPH